MYDLGFHARETPEPICRSRELGFLPSWIHTHICTCYADVCMCMHSIHRRAAMESGCTLVAAFHLYLIQLLQEGVNWLHEEIFPQDSYRTR